MTIPSMRIRSQSRFRFVSIIVLITILSACGGGSDSSSNSINLPPDPGEDGKLTLEGIDSDNDGLRDDLQIAVYNRFPDDDPTRAALVQRAKALQEAIIAGDSLISSEVNTAAKSILKAVECMHAKVKNPASPDLFFLEELLVNTSARADAYINFNEMLSGQSFSIDVSESSCE